MIRSIIDSVRARNLLNNIQKENTLMNNVIEMVQQRVEDDCQKAGSRWISAHCTTSY